MRTSRTRIGLGVAVALLAAFVALLFGGGTVQGCLGPLDVTAVRCAHATGRLPTFGVPIGVSLLAAVCAGALVAVGLPRSRSVLAAAGAGAAVGGALGLATRQATLEGPDYDGTWLSLPLPVDPGPIAWWAVAAALAAMLLVALAARRSGERASTSRADRG